MAAANPFVDPVRFERRVPPCALVIFGANGDLTKRKLMPALYRLFYDRRLPKGFAIIGSSRTPMSHDQFREKMREGVQEFSEGTPFDDAVWSDLASGIFYEAGDLRDPKCYAAIEERLEQIARDRQTGGNVLFYLSTQPAHYETVIGALGESGLWQAQAANGVTPWRRVVVEKPFGHDLASAAQLESAIHRVFHEENVYRIDHYLGKETVQNILAFRFGNGIFEPLWNRNYISHVQITAAESIGVEGRGEFYQQVGALRDMIQNHLLQVMATVTMEPPATFEANAVRDERAKLLRSIRISKADDVLANTVAGQYARGRMGGQDLPGFREEPGVAPDARTNTYAAATFFVDNWRWAGVPFYVRTGKRLARRVTDIAIQFHQAPHAVFNQDGQDGAPWAGPNLLVLRVQPEEGISLRFLSKLPGTGMNLRPVTMDFKYGSSFGVRSPAAYETLLLDALEGDATLYTRRDMVEASWEVVQPILDVWENNGTTIHPYEAGSWGPQASDEMLSRRGHQWRTP
ncbi:MAG: glucose-6-phosphate dehydrogenase [Bryobacteraceae bacterium]